ncbi:hypothetical protein TREMEDRAFT_66519 [Tremella mesenterica DSM 1558]|uniref:uncharacterized protein n=1 Tax=Tremella mesenterica (strain ATCC 24925 / CBS 8224 / DSM 1558 / NBRC 9311 / NRRL Y-6157 / RJB 2259-6 / UBC 559-6) TaxID=578456 RepID=UPI00032BBFCA|nr:uncharacterized protein TREMEDRAFT_66519 [Tremella mesenterica DSM 1558]EIW65524.1 hypothetical protein TREMEDRAFT_66519 [Tremella mesenterica DSM 1558]
MNDIDSCNDNDGQQGDGDGDGDDTYTPPAVGKGLEETSPIPIPSTKPTCNLSSGPSSHAYPHVTTPTLQSTFQTFHVSPPSTISPSKPRSNEILAHIFKSLFLGPAYNNNDDQPFEPRLGIVRESSLSNVHVPGGVECQDTTINLVLKWLYSKARGGPGQHPGRLRMLEIGALLPDNMAECSSWIDNHPIDLQSQHPLILQQDFFHRPVPVKGSDEWFDIISCTSTSSALISTPDISVRAQIGVKPKRSRRAQPPPPTSFSPTQPPNAESTSTSTRSFSTLTDETPSTKRRRVEQLAENYWCCVFSVLEVKLHLPRQCLAQALAYAVGSFEQCGCRVAVAMYRSRFTPILVLDSRNVTIETNDHSSWGRVDNMRHLSRFLGSMLPYDLDASQTVWESLRSDRDQPQVVNQPDQQDQNQRRTRGHLPVMIDQDSTGVLLGIIRSAIACAHTIRSDGTDVMSRDKLVNLTRQPMLDLKNRHVTRPMTLRSFNLDRTSEMRDFDRVRKRHVLGHSDLENLASICGYARSSELLRVLVRLFPRSDVQAEDGSGDQAEDGSGGSGGDGGDGGGGGGGGGGRSGPGGGGDNPTPDQGNGQDGSGQGGDTESYQPDTNCE